MVLWGCGKSLGSFLWVEKIHDGMHKMTQTFASMCACPFYTPTQDLNEFRHWSHVASVQTVFMVFQPKTIKKIHRTSEINKNWHACLRWCCEGVEKDWAHLIKLEKKTPFKLHLRQTRTVLVAHDVRDGIAWNDIKFCPPCVHASNLARSQPPNHTTEHISGYEIQEQVLAWSKLNRRQSWGAIPIFESFSHDKVDRLNWRNL